MKAADTSVVVAAFASWHVNHEACRRALDGGLRIIEHCAVETYSVLTRLPSPHRVSAEVARDFIAARFQEPWLRLSPDGYRAFALGLAEREIVGGGAYDALIAATAAECDAELHSCDRRALRIYDLYGLRTRFVE